MCDAVGDGDAECVDRVGDSPQATNDAAAVKTTAAVASALPAMSPAYGGYGGTETQFRPWELSMRARRRIQIALAVGAVLFAGCSADESGDEPSASTAGSPSVSASPEVETEASEPEKSEPEESETETEAAESEPTVRAVSVLGLAEQRHRGDRLRLGAVREQTPEYTSYDVTYRSRTPPGRARSPTPSQGSSTCPPGVVPFRQWCWRTATSTQRSTSAAKG